MELHPVIMGAGRGSRLMDITYRCPRALLPVANVPAICYPIAMLERCGFDEAIVIVPEEHNHDIQKAVSDFGVTKIRLDFVGIPDVDSLGTADSLRHVKDKIKSDVLVLSCDLITDLPLHRVMDVYRTHNASLTVLLSSTAQQLSELPPPGLKTKRKIERDIIGLDEGGGRLIFFSSEADLEETIKFRKSLLKKHPCITMKTNLTDCHLYIMKKWLVSYLYVNKSISSIKGELLPHLIKKQFSKSHDNEDINKAKSSVISVDLKPDIFTYMEETELQKMATTHSSWNDHHGDMDDSYHGDRIRCYGYVLDDQSCFCARANNLSSYCEINRQMGKHLASMFPDRGLCSIVPTMKGKSQIGSECLLDVGVSTGDKVSIKRSVVGKHCVIGDRVKIANSVIMNYVTIEEGSTISGSVISSHAHIGEKSEIKDSIIGERKTTVPLSKLTNEVHTDSERMMEI